MNELYCQQAPLSYALGRSLEALDLSFNNISEISGLDALTNLSTLSLFANRITQL